MLDSTHIAPESERPLRRVEYERLVESGSFADEHLELLAGRLVRVSPQGPRHAEVIKRLTRLLVTALGARADVNPQLPLAATEDSEPEPDLSVVPPGDYSAAHPTTAWLVVEVTQSSGKLDRVLKADLYATANVELYWLVDLELNVVEVRSDPQGGLYRALTTLRPGDELSLPRFPDVKLPVAALLR